MKPHPIEINRAPVFTLWAAVVAERLGYDHDAALTLGKAVAGLNAQSKGRRLGIYKPSEKPAAAKKPKPVDEVVELCGRAVPAHRTDHGIRAVAGDRVIDPKRVNSYLKRSFGDDLPVVESAMKSLARKFNPPELEQAAYGLYEQFRPNIPGGKRGWGAKGELDLGLIRELS